MPTRTIELSTQTPDTIHVGDGENVTFQQLEPSDGGRNAWQVLTAAFLFEALLWGFPVCFGVFQEHYSRLPELRGKNIALIGTTSQGLPYLTAPFSAALVKRFPQYQRHFIWFGWALCIVALGTGSLTTQLGGLIATQGLMYGFGFVILYWPIMNMVNEWWVVRKGFAFGLISSAAGVAGAILPFVFQALLANYGYKTTLRGTAIVIALVTGPLIPFCKSRLPTSEQNTLANMDWQFGKRPLFWSFVLATVVQGLGLFFPAVFLPSYATDIGLKNSMGALLLSLMAMSQFCGQSAFGFLSDKQFSPSALAIVCCIATALSAFLLWGFAKSTPILIAFSLVHGFFGYGFSAMRSAMAKQLTSDPNTLIALQSILNGSLGVGNILVGPLSSTLITGNVNVGEYGVQKYVGLVNFTGSCMLASTIVLMISFFLSKQSKQ